MTKEMINNGSDRTQRQEKEQLLRMSDIDGTTHKNVTQTTIQDSSRENPSKLQ